MLWTEMWEVEYFVTLLAEPSRRTPADHDCVCELELVGHLGRNDSIAGRAEGLGGHGTGRTNASGSAALAQAYRQVPVRRTSHLKLARRSTFCGSRRRNIH